MRIIKWTFNFLILYSSLSIAGQLTNIYKEHIPQQFKSPQYLSDVESRLNLYGRIDPHLIYIYLSHLDLKFNKKILDRDKNLSEHLRLSFNKAKQVNNDWTEVQTKLCQNKNYSSVKEKEIILHYPKYQNVRIISHPFLLKWQKINDIDSISIPISFNINKQAFFTYLYLVRDSTLKYDSNFDYIQKVEKGMHKLVTEFNQVFNTTDNLSQMEKDNSLRHALEYPYLFRETYLEYVTNQTDFRLFEFLEKVLKDKYKKQNQIGFQLMYNPFSTKMVKTNVYNDYLVKNYKKRLDAGVNAPIRFYASLRLKIIEEYERFSFLNLKIGYSASKSITENIGNSIIFEGLRANPGIYFNGIYSFSEPMNKKYQSINVQLTTPIYYFNKDIIIEAGVHYLYQQTKIEYNIIKDGELRIHGIEFAIIEPFNYRKTENIVLPVISIHYQLSRLLTISGDFIIPDFGTIGLGFGFLF